MVYLKRTLTGCAWTACERSRDRNSEKIYEEAVNFYKKYGYDYSNLANAMKYPTKGASVDTLKDTIKLECYGDNDGHGIIEYINSAVWIGCGSIPLILFVIAVLVFFKCITPGMRLSVSRWLCLPCCLIKDSKQTTTYLCGPCK